MTTSIDIHNVVSIKLTEPRPLTSTNVCIRQLEVRDSDGNDATITLYASKAHQLREPDAPARTKAELAARYTDIKDQLAQARLDLQHHERAAEMLSREGGGAQAQRAAQRVRDHVQRLDGYRQALEWMLGYTLS